MEPSGSRSEMGEGGVMVLTKPTRLALTLPAQNPAEVFLRSSDAATPSPMTFVSSLFAEHDPYADGKSFSQLLAGAMASPTKTLIGEGAMESGSAVDLTGSNGSSKVTRSDTAKFKSMMPSRLPIPRSPYLTIPPGLSPTTLLDSPVLFSRGQVEPSPTTGTFSLPPLIQKRGPTDASACDSSTEGSRKQDGSPKFVFKPHPTLATSIPSPLASMGPFGFSHQQALAEVQAQAQSQSLSGSSGIGTSPVSKSASLLTLGPSSNGPKLVTPSSHVPVEPTVGSLAEDSESVPLAQVPSPAHPPPHLVERSSEDGYNWRKYGQKQVKGSEYPRSYYKCTTPNCAVKKKVERSYDGQVTEIVYRGEHNHAKPQATRRPAMGGAHIPDGTARGPSQAETSLGFGKVDSDKRSADPSSSSRWQGTPFSGNSAATPEPSLGSISDDDGEDGEGSKADDNDDEPDSKLRRIEKANETFPLRTVREPRVVVQTPSEIDILDDGYRWRKYGQKVVKGSAHPRSYYKCTNLGCTVRKHVERSSTDFKAVITTYEGKHNHDVPAARNSNHDTSGASTASVPLQLGSAVSGQGPLMTSTLANPLPSLQEQLFGKPHEDRVKAGDIMAVGIQTDSGRSIKGPLTSEQNKGGIDISIPSSMSLLGTGSTLLGSAEVFRQGFGWKPKEEPGEFHSSASLLPTYPSNSISLVAQKILLGP